MWVFLVCCCLYGFWLLLRAKRRRFNTDLSVTTTQQQQEKIEKISSPSSSSSSSSSLSFIHPCPYDVFLSFRGVDTRNNFTGHLHTLLVQKGIRVFIDDNELSEGEEISSALLKAIQGSKISIIIFSENYAFSRWCLDELVHILQWRESNNQLVWPIFYKVDPSVVRHQMGVYGEALAKHESRLKHYKMDKVHRWRTALTDAANLSGWTFIDGHEANFISKIVEKISAQVLERTHLNVAKYPIGIESRVQEMLEHLDIEGSDVRMVGIWGIGGIGKTTIAKAVYNTIAHKFEGCCFLRNVRGESESHQGLVGLQNILLSELLGEKKMKLTDVDRGINVIKERLGSKRVLLVLDDVSELNQLDTLAGDSNWFGCGSRIIITTRDKHLLVAHQVYSIYTAKGLGNDEACKLLSLYAVKENRNVDEFPITTAVMYTYGHPLAISILGSLLCGKSIDQWQAALDSYKRFPNSHIQKVHETSYRAFKGSDKFDMIQLIQALGGSGIINPLHAIEQLEEKALLNTGSYIIQMHDLLEEMGKEIDGKESHSDAGRGSSLWLHEDVFRLLTENPEICTFPEPEHMDPIPTRQKPKLERRNAVKHIEYDGEFERICASLGFSGPDDLAIPEAAWEAWKIRSSNSDVGPLSKLYRMDSSNDDDSSSSTTEPNERISPIGKFTINTWLKGELLGSGSFGSVYEGISDEGFFFAVKEVSLLDQGNLGRQRVYQLEQEIALLSQFEHENIVEYYGTQKDESKLYIFLELITQGSLQKLYQTYHLTDPHVSVYTRQILQGLKYLHDRRVIHRDIKCANLLVHANGSVKLADFGLAKITQMNDIKSCEGTAFWMAPEVVNHKSKGYGLPADIWSLGCTVLEMLTGMVPYHNFQRITALWKISKGEPPLVPDSLSSEARDFIHKCLQVKPDNRPTAAELLNHPFVNGEKVTNSTSTMSQIQLKYPKQTKISWVK